MGLGLLFNKYVIIALVLLALIGGSVLYVKITSNTIKDLRDKVTVLEVQNKDLQVAKDALEADIKEVQKAQTETNQKLIDIRLAAAQQVRDIANHKYNTQDMKALNGQINADMATVLHNLELLSHAQ